jgi:hypothetical protein
MTDRLSPVGYYCDHSDEKPGDRTHQDWEWIEEQGYVFQHKPDTVSSHSSVDQRYLKAENRETRCPRAVPVYTGPAVAAELDRLRDEIADDIHRAELPTFAESENPVLVAKTVRAIDVRLADRGPEAPYWMPKSEEATS